ncbi:MAG: SDR family NAD(P)-dependent oxidoreductase [Magnetospirillum sp.]|nr:SDR family NAD(P)-dependent oxidoreductase [Magnetospirillum sp.]
MYPWKSILITGGSSGLGEAMALELARPGVALALTGRDAARLAAVAEACRAKGAAVVAEPVDVVDARALSGFMARVDASTPLDLVVANAGISAGTGGGIETPAQTAQILAVNVQGVVDTVQPALAAMGPRGKGQIAILSSLAGFRGFPGAPTYCASKAFVRVWGESLRGDWGPRGIKINVICPGFVRSRITAKNDFKMPLLMEAGKAAKIMLSGLARDVPRIAYPRRMYWLVRLLAALPQRLLDAVLAKTPRKR